MEACKQKMRLNDHERKKNKILQEYDIPKDRRTEFSNKEEVCEDSPYLRRKKESFYT